MPHDPAIFTIGYGHRDIDSFVDILREHNITFLGDVRTRANSLFNPDFSADLLKVHLTSAGITYVFLGDTLGGDPSTPDVRRATRSGDETSYVVDYTKVRKHPQFKQGLSRLQKAWEARSRLVLMCSEAKPEQCHRVRLIGVVLEEEGIPIRHIDENGTLRTQQEIILRIDNGQPSLPGFGPSPKASTSSRSWKVRKES